MWRRDAAEAHRRLLQQQQKFASNERAMKFATAANSQFK
jgi:hypothetical protein